MNAPHPVADFIAAMAPRPERAAFPLVYCDFISDRIRRGLQTDDAKAFVAHVGPVKSDLTPDGAFRSCNKTLTVTDKNGRRYRVSVEEVSP